MSNQVLVARSVDFGDLEAVRVAVEMTHDYLNLALEHLAGGELKIAIEHLRDTHLQLLFRLGVSLTIDLRKRAETVVAALGLAPARAREIAYLDSPYREAIAGFMQRQPQFYGGLDRDGSVAMRDFRAMRDLHLGYAMLEQVDAVPELFQELLKLDIAAPAFRAANRRPRHPAEPDPADRPGALRARRPTGDRTDRARRSAGAGARRDNDDRRAAGAAHRALSSITWTRRCARGSTKPRARARPISSIHV